MHVPVNSEATFNNNNSKDESLPSKIMKIFTSENSRLSSRRRLTTSHTKTGSSKMHNYTYNSIISLQSCVFLPILLLLLIGESNCFLQFLNSKNRFNHQPAYHLLYLTIYVLKCFMKLS